MRAILRCGGVAAVGLALGLGCSSSDDDLHRASVPGVVVAADAGAAGTAGQAADAAGGSTGEPSGLEVIAGASGACAGDYICPAVGYYSSATVTMDLPVPVADASEAEVTACRNSECHSGLGGAKQDDFVWAYTRDGAYIELKLDDSGTTPAARLAWYFNDYSGSVTTPGDHYSLTIQPAGAATATALFDAQVTYTTAPSDPTLVSEGYCRHCSDVFMGNVDARAKK